MSRLGPIDAIIRQQEEEQYTTQVLDLREVQEHPNNDFPITNNDIEKLADSILKSGGILQFPLVRRLKDGTYQMLAGHRRRRASLMLGDNGHEEFYRTMCYIIEDISDEKAELFLIDTNIQARELSPRLRAKKVADARSLIEKLKERKEIQIRSVRRAVAEVAGISESTVILQSRIAEQLSEGLMELYDQGKFTMRDAYNYSGLPEPIQQEVLKAYEKGWSGLSIEKMIAKLTLEEGSAKEVASKKEQAAKKKANLAYARLQDLVDLKNEGVSLDYRTLRKAKRLIDELIGE